MTQFDDCQRSGFELMLSIAGENRDFVTLSSSGARVTTNVLVLWSTDALHQFPIAAADGGIYYEGDVLLSVRVSDLPGLPVPDGFIESPAGRSYVVNDVTEDFGVYQIKLRKNFVGNA
jgi:hypothetical protein